MTRYVAPLKDLRFALHGLLDSNQALAGLDGFGEVSPELVDAVLEEAARFCENVLAPLNGPGDRQGCHFDPATGEVTAPDGFKQAYHQYVEGGWAGLTADAEFGGQGLPEVVGAAVKEMIDSANLPWGNYPLLSHGASEALKQHGEPWQREVFLKPIVEGRWTGTMCLTEPHCGTDLGLLKTRAEPAGDDGSYRITGTKIFITAGEHDFTENIIHLVLARLPDAPAGTRGISLFIVPKFQVDRDGQMGERNALSCGAIEEKMGIHASATCVMNFDGAHGWLIGEPNRGLNAMFTMMNTARLAVGLQGLALSERAWQSALPYARERLQGRALDGPAQPDKPADPLMVHADVRRMLLTQKAIIESGRALTLYAFLLVDIQHRSADEAQRLRAEELVSFLTPIVKGVLTELAIECTYNAVQVFGGHGYITETGVEQLARDARITTLYEGTTQIQALDLLGRKVLQLNGVGLKHLLEEITQFCQTHASHATAAEFVGPLAVFAKALGDLTMEIAQRAQQDPNEMAAASVDYLFICGYVTLAWFWARAVTVEDVPEEQAQSKLNTARFYFARILPRVHAHTAAINSGAASLMAMPDEQFD